MWMICITIFWALEMGVIMHDNLHGDKFLKELYRYNHAVRALEERFPSADIAISERNITLRIFKSKFCFESVIEFSFFVYGLTSVYYLENGEKVEPSAIEVWDRS